MHLVKLQVDEYRSFGNVKYTYLLFDFKLRLVYLQLKNGSKSVYQARLSEHEALLRLKDQFCLEMFGRTVDVNRKIKSS